MWFDLMVDEETMGKPPAGALVALGACFFDMKTCTIGPTFYRTIHLATSVNLGMTIDADTVLWWLRQSTEAQAAIAFNSYDIRLVLEEFTAFIEEHSLVPDVRPWGNAATFDLTILGSAYRLANIPQPWRYGKERCFRTVRNMYPKVEYDPSGQREGTHHRADDDAIFQARHMFKIKEAARG